MENEYEFEVKIVVSQLVSAETKEKAEKIVKQDWWDNYNLELQDKEINLINTTYN